MQTKVDWVSLLRLFSLFSCMTINRDTIVLGDSLKELKKIPKETFDCIFADPPYNLQLQSSLERPDHSKVKAVNDELDKFENYKTRYLNFSLGYQ